MNSYFLYINLMIFNIIVFHSISEIFKVVTEAIFLGILLHC
jgi:hypothetical protein